MRIRQLVRAVLGGMMLLVPASCAQSPALRPVATVPPGHISPVDRVVLARYLPDLAKAHRNKTQLAFLARFKGLSAPVAKFNAAMDRQQGRLLGQLQAWAGRHHFNLQYHVPKSVRGDALRGQTQVDSHLLLMAGDSEFQHMYLVLMYTDFTWQVSLDRAMLPYATNHGLKAYLLSALAINRASRRQIVKLLAQYHWTPAGH